MNDEFWVHIESHGDCLFWMGRRNRAGYGQIHIAGRSIGAHRHAFERLHGPIPPGMQVLHKCDHPPCVNAFCTLPDCDHRRGDCPSHLFLGTQQDNAQDRVGKDRVYRSLRQVQGRVTLRQIEEIVARYAAGEVDMWRLGQDYGVMAGTIGSLLRWFETYPKCGTTPRGVRLDDPAVRVFMQSREAKFGPPKLRNAGRFRR